MKSYQRRIYKEYASRMQDSSCVFDEAEAVHWGHAYDTFLKGWLPHHKNAVILDVGCGGGKLLHFLKSKGYKNLQGVDISPQQVALARQVTGDVARTDAISFLEDHKECYDLVIGLDIVEHFSKDKVLCFLDAIYQALKPGGRVILQTPNPESPLGMKIRYGDFTHELAFDPNCLERLLGLSGFSQIDVRSAGPVVHGMISLGRYLIWKVIQVGLLIWNLAETGSKGSGIYTRVFLITGRRIGK